MHRVKSLIVLFSLVATTAFAGIIDGSKDPDKVPDKLAFQLFLRSVGVILTSDNPQIRGAIGGLFEIYHFELADIVAFKAAALKFLADEKLIEQTARSGNPEGAKAAAKKLSDDAYSKLGSTKSFKDALKDIKKGIILDDSELSQ